MIIAFEVDRLDHSSYLSLKRTIKFEFKHLSRSIKKIFKLLMEQGQERKETIKIDF